MPKIDFFVNFSVFFILDFIGNSVLMVFFYAFGRPS